MRDSKLISVTVVTDDETGIYDIGDLDYLIDHFRLMDYLRDGDLTEKRNKLFASLGFLMCKVQDYCDDVAKGKI